MPPSSTLLVPELQQLPAAGAEGETTVWHTGPQAGPHVGFMFKVKQGCMLSPLTKGFSLPPGPQLSALGMHTHL